MLHAVAGAFRHYLSAFRNAAYSVSQHLTFEAQSVRGFSEWFRQWQAALPPADREIWEFMWRLRRGETHTRRTKTVSETKAVPLPPSRGHPAYYGLHYYRNPMLLNTSPDAENPWAKELGLPPWVTAWQEVQIHKFATKGKRHDVVERCERHVALLRKLVDDFKITFS